MAILNGPYASKMRGKVGEVVAAKTTGNRTALRSYQPNVKNPNTLRQRVSRTKLAMASALAANLSEGIKIGYAKAVAGTRMYPRNMFVSDIVPVGANVFSVSDGVVTMNTGGVRVSKGIGISVVPDVTQQQVSGSADIELVATNTGLVNLPAGSKLGLVVVVSNRDLTKCAVLCGEAESPVRISENILNAFGEPGYFVFYKEITESFNGVATADIPWKYPSLTGPSSTLTMVS